MVVGDVVSGINTGVGAYQYFQPAASVECCITHMMGWGTITIAQTNGVLIGKVNGVSAGYNLVGMKMMINNTNYLGYYADADNAGYSGIQIK
jgi:hypothetical protein